MLPLEDLYTDIIAKAQRGLRFTDAALSKASGVSLENLAKLKSGEPSEAAILAIAPHLHLDGPRLLTIARGEWRPPSLNLEGLLQFTSQFGDMTVNAYLVWDPITREAAAFDSGTDATPMLREIEQRALLLRGIFLTHTHRDHIASLPQLSNHGSIPIHSNVFEQLPGSAPFHYGTTFPLGSLTIETRRTTGHTVGGTTYVVTGLDCPLAIVGDALFAGSIGGGLVSWTEAIETNRSAIFSLPENTIVCPGHGPLTTVGEERGHNPVVAFDPSKSP